MKLLFQQILNIHAQNNLQTEENLLSKFKLNQLGCFRKGREQSQRKVDNTNRHPNTYVF